ncbi:DUF2202 domain-containing protein [Spirochaetia bacterium 38H-sp]|uniref:DUF2202 domain-containing protein n=1 Tax=Rarispira pelagica TaxID=3141764 RepID=A0ABU9U9Q0_9SPIR
MKKLIIMALIITTVAATAFAAPWKNGQPQQPQAQNGQYPGSGNGMMGENGDRPHGMGMEDNMGFRMLESIPASELSAKEKQDIESLIEYEKLLGDIEAAYAKTFPGSMFDRHADAPHGTAFDFFLERYGLDNPVEGMKEGEYKNSSLESRYKKLAGETELKDAVKNSLALTEELLVKVRQARENSDNEDLDIFYIRFEQGLANRLASGAKLLVFVGETYKPSYLSQDELDELILNTRAGGPGRKDFQPDGQGRGNPGRGRK